MGSENFRKVVTYLAFVGFKFFSKSNGKILDISMLLNKVRLQSKVTHIISLTNKLHVTFGWKNEQIHVTIFFIF
jgi:hypothetical protein